MDWFRILQWISIVILWVCIGLQTWLLHRNWKLREKLKENEKAYEEAVAKTWAARDQYYEMIEEYRKRGFDERNVDDNGCR